MKYKTILEHPYSFRFKKRNQIKQRVKQVQLNHFQKGNALFRRQWYNIVAGRYTEAYDDLDFVN